MRLRDVLRSPEVVVPSHMLSRVCSRRSLCALYYLAEEHGPVISCLILERATHCALVSCGLRLSGVWTSMASSHYIFIWSAAITPRDDSQN